MNTNKLYQLVQEYQKAQEAKKALAKQLEALAAELKAAVKENNGEPIDLGDVSISINTAHTYTIKPSALAAAFPKLGYAAFKVDTVALRKVLPEKYGINRKDVMDAVINAVPEDAVTVKVTERLQVKPKAL